jgi:uncharacterized protein (TIGR02246 family)
MKIRHSGIWLAALLIAAGCAPEREATAPADLEHAIDAFYAAIEAGDADAHIAAFTDDALMLPNHWVPARGREAVAEMIRAGEGSVFRLRNRELVDIDVDGDLAYTVNAYEYTYHPEGAEPQWHKTKNVHIWKRDGEGLWRLHVDIWNSDVPMSEFLTE